MGQRLARESHFDHIKKGDKALKESPGTEVDRQEAALEHYNKAVEMNVHYFLSYVRRGSLLISMKRYEEAKDDFTIALDLKEDCFTARLALADCLDELDECDVAAMERSKVPRDIRNEAITQRRLREKLAEGGSHRTGKRAAGSPEDDDTAALFEKFEKGEEDDDEEARELGFRKMTDNEKYKDLDSKFRQDLKRAQNIHNFMHGKRKQYVTSAAERTRVARRAEVKDRLRRYEMTGAVEGHHHAAAGSNRGSSSTYGYTVVHGNQL